MKTILPSLIALLAIAPALRAADKSDKLFDPAAPVRTLQLQLTPDQWKAVEPTQSRQNGNGGFMRRMEYPVVHATVTMEGKTYADVAMRYKGNSSFMMARNSIKKSIKLDFNKFVEGRTFHGLTTVNLNNNAGDPSESRETLAYELFAAAKVPAPRTTILRVELTVPGAFDHKFMGCYTLVEEVGKRFLKSRFDESKGLLLKPDMARDLPYLGDRWDDYKRMYVPKTDGSDATRARFMEFLKLVHNADDATFDAQVESILDVDEFLRFLAVNAVTSNLDSILSMGHNFYVYVPEKLGPIQFIPWDLNEAFGGFGMGMTPQTQQQLSLLHPHAGQNKLIERVLATPRFKRRYFAIIAELSNGAFAVPTMNARIDALASLTGPLIAEEKKANITVGPPGGGGMGGRPGGGFGGGPSFGGPRDGQPRDGGPGPDGPSFGGPRNDNNGGNPGRGGPNGPGFGGPGGPGGGPGGPRVKPELKPFVAARNQSIADQLAGKSAGQIPTGRMPGGRGGPGGGPRPNGPPPPPRTAD